MNGHDLCHLTCEASNGGVLATSVRGVALDQIQRHILFYCVPKR